MIYGRRLLAAFLLALYGYCPLVAEPVKVEKAVTNETQEILDKMKSSNRWDELDDDDCATLLKIKKLCARLIKARCIIAKVIEADEICTKKLNATDFCATTANVDSLCTTSARSDFLCSTDAYARNLFAQDATLNTACVSHLTSSTLDLNNLCSQVVQARELFAETADLNTLCALQINTQELLAQRAQLNELCAQVVQLSQLCVDNLQATTICAASIEHCTPFKAFVQNSSDQPYTLGDIIEFDTIVDDPNNDIILSPFTTYTAPRSGYYTVNLNIVTADLDGPTVISGIPVSQPEVLVNGVRAVLSRFSFLSFSNLQYSAITGLMRLNAGDVVSSRFKVIVQDPNTGEAEYPGTVTLKDGVNATSFLIHYLSSDCPVECFQCPGNLPCEPVIIDCAPVTVSCNPIVCEPFTINCAPCAFPCVPCTPCVQPPCVCPTV